MNESTVAEASWRLERVARELEVLARTHGVEVHARLRTLMARLDSGSAESAAPRRTSGYRDAHTGLYSYRFFQEQLEHEIRSADQAGSPLSLVVLDIDDFTSYKELNGQEAGRQALVEVARLLGPVLRRRDVAIRYGSGVFILLLPVTPKGLAGRLADCVRQRIEGHAFPGGDSQPGGGLTISLGVATYPGDAQNGHELVARADRALYLARESGQNRVRLFGDNLRSHRRIEARLKGDFRQLEPETHPLDTVNLSEAGMLFRSERSVSPGAFLQVRLRLPRQRYALDLLSQVVRVVEGAGDQREIAVRFVDVSYRDRERLADYLRRREAEGDAGDSTA